MITKISAKNYRSINKPAEISLTAANYPFLNNNCFNNILKGCLFFGGNASGKSSILSVFSLLIKLLSNGNLGHLKNDFCVFSDEKIMSFNYDFLIDNHQVSYSFSFNNDGDLEEEIYKIDDEMIFNRKDLKTLEKVFINKPYNNELSFYKNKITSDFKNFEIVLKWKEFIENSIIVENNKSNNEAYPRINEIIGEDYLLNYINEGNLVKLNDFFNKYHIPYQLVKNDNKIFFSRFKINRMIPFEKESLGIRTLCVILPALLTLKERNGYIVIDEFSSSFHNKLEELVIRDVMKDYRGSQFFFVSHSTNLMKNSLLRPEQIFIADFDENGSNFVSVSSFNPRPSQNIEKMYLSGVFGGIPLYDEYED